MFTLFSLDLFVATIMNASVLWRMQLACIKYVANILSFFSFSNIATTGSNKTLLYLIVLQCIILYCVVLCYLVLLYCIALHCIALHCIVLYCIVLYCIVLYCIVLYCIVLSNFSPWSRKRSTKHAYLGLEQAQISSDTVHFLKPVCGYLYSRKPVLRRGFGGPADCFC